MHKHATALTAHNQAGGNVIYAGVDYEAILRKAEQEADVIVWDGGNNDFAFYKPDLTIVVLDPHRAGDELRFVYMRMCAVDALLACVHAWSSRVICLLACRSYDLTTDTTQEK